MGVLQRVAILASGLVIAFATAVGAVQIDLSPEQPGRPHTNRDERAIALLPKDVRLVTPGTLTVATAPSNPPLSAYATDSRTPVGSEPDFASLLAEALGLKLVLLPVAWAEWPLGLQSGKYDAVISNVTVTEERKLKFDFSTYRKDDLGFHVASNSPITSIKEPKDVAGLRIIVSSGTNQEKILLEWDRQNVANGLKPVEIQYYNDQALRDLALQSGRADAVLGPNAHGAYRASLDGKIRLAGTVSGGWPRTAEIAVATRKDSGLAEAFTAAINGLIADGTYAKVLQRWNLESEGIERSLTNPPGLPRT